MAVHTPLLMHNWHIHNVCIPGRDTNHDTVFPGAPCISLPSWSYGAGGKSVASHPCKAGNFTTTRITGEGVSGNHPCLALFDANLNTDQIHLLLVEGLVKHAEQMTLMPAIERWVVALYTERV